MYLAARYKALEAQYLEYSGISWLLIITIKTDRYMF